MNLWMLCVDLPMKAFKLILLDSINLNSVIRSVNHLHYLGFIFMIFTLTRGLLNINTISLDSHHLFLEFKDLLVNILSHTYIWDGIKTLDLVNKIDITDS